MPGVLHFRFTTRKTKIKMNPKSCFLELQGGSPQKHCQRDQEFHT